MASIFIARDNTRLGSFSEDEIREGLRAGRFFPTDLGWREGMESWKPLTEFSELGSDAGLAAPGAPPPLVSAPRDVTSPTASPYLSSTPPATAAQPLQTMTKRITRVGPLQFGLVLAVFYAIISLILLLFLFLLTLAGVKASDTH